MQPQSVSADSATIQFSEPELLLLAQCVVEALEALADEAFEEQVGAPKSDARTLLGALQETRHRIRDAAQPG
ncbi:MAG TPA: hypothetical protein VNG13_06565 [Mycobacteriales bacterium]|nr:hypothetical protein [Mycobacteriales bacterium]